MKKVWISLLVLGLLAGCSSKESSKEPETVKATSDVKVATQQLSDDEYIQVSLQSADKLTASAAQLQTLLKDMDADSEEWQSNVETSMSELSKAVNYYMMVEIKLSSEQQKKFSETKSYYSQGVSSFSDIINKLRTALSTNDVDTILHIQDMQLKQATNLIGKAKEQLEVERK